MADKIILAWKVRVAGTSLGPAGANTKLAAVPLYVDPTTDPVLGQHFGLTVDTDVTTNDASSATRTLTLNMTSAVGVPHAPPPFPCRPDTATPPVLPYALRRTVTLAGSFLTTSGSAVVATSANQTTAVSPGDVLEFESQLGVYYTVAPGGVAPTAITLTALYTAATADGGAVKVQPAPAKLAALYSTSVLDTAAVATAPAIPAGAGAQSVKLEYIDSTGAGPFLVTVPLRGRSPAPVPLALGSIDIATIVDMFVFATGGFKNSVGQITLAELEHTLPAIAANATPADFLGPITDQAQLLIARPLAYLPPSYFALAQQGASAPSLAGDFFVTTGSANVPTTVDQTAALAPGNVVRFASQEDASYTVATVTASPGGIGGLVTLTTPYTGLDRTNAYDSDNIPRPSNVTARADKQPTGAMLIVPSPATPPSNAQLASPLAQFVNPGNAVPPPNPPLAPQTMAPAPTFLSSLFTQTLQLALAVPVEPQAITFA